MRPSLNLVQDIPSSRALFDSGVPLVYLPGYHVGAQLKISLPEMERFVAPRGAIGALLHDLYLNNPLHRMFALTDTARRTWVIWDIICIAWLLNPDWVPTFLTTSPVLTDDLHWRKDEGRHLIREGMTSSGTRSSSTSTTACLRRNRPRPDIAERPPPQRGHARPCRKLQRRRLMRAGDQDK